MKKELRVNMSAGLRAFEEEDTLEFKGYAAVFNEDSQDLGGFKERISPGAFGESILKDDVRALVNHDPNYVIGRNKSGTLRLMEDDKGLYFEVKAPKTQWARDLKVSVERGDIDQCSFGFLVEEDEWQREGEMDMRTLKRCSLFDVSIVTYPAYEGTSVRSAKEVYENRSKQEENKEDLDMKFKLYERMIK